MRKAQGIAEEALTLVDRAERVARGALAECTPTQAIETPEPTQAEVLAELAAALDAYRAKDPSMVYTVMDDGSLLFTREDPL